MSLYDTYDNPPLDRRAHGSTKWNAYPEDVVPLWVADMDFPAPPAVIAALRRQVDHGVFGYLSTPPALNDLIVQRMQARYGWQIQAEHLVYIPGVIAGINMLARALGPNPGILIQPPVYFPFHHIAHWSDGQHQEAPLTRVELPNGQFSYTVDSAAFEAAFTEQTKMFLLCNPHNPVGRVWSADELRQMAEVALAKGAVICSDEIHSDLLLGGYRHTPIATLSPEIEQRTVTLIAPSKTFNLPGLNLSVAIIPNPELRRQFVNAGAGLVTLTMGEDQYFSMINMMGYVAAEAAYRDGDSWLAHTLDYIQANRDYAVNTIREQMPTLKTAVLEGTFLLWIDASAAHLPEPAGEWFAKVAKVGMNDGASFGAAEGKGHVRMNLACSRATLREALRRMAEALQTL
ncbi:MAG: MalY/PatB family protein [Phototrophicaceae bacterium]|jgi:cystathionine beta-lyase